MGTETEDKGCFLMAPNIFSSHPIPLFRLCQKKPQSPGEGEGGGRQSQAPDCNARLLSDPKLTYDAEGSSESFHTGKFAGPAIVYRVGSYEVRQEPQVTPSHLLKGCVIQFGPGAVYDRDP